MTIQALNGRGQIAGYHDPERGPRMAFIWDQRNGMQDLGPPDSIESLACDLNDSGEVVGFFSAMRSNQWYAFKWDPKAGVQNLGITRSGMTHTCYTNNQGGIVGIFGADDDTTVSMWTREGGMQNATYIRGTFARVVGLNEANHFIVCIDRNELRIGRFAVLPYKASFICDPNGGFKDIAHCLGRKDVVGFVAMGINNKGQIIGLLMLEKELNSLGVILEPIR